MNTEYVAAQVAKARAAYASAKSRRALRDAAEDLEFWSNKAAMLDAMQKRMAKNGGVL